MPSLLLPSLNNPFPLHGYQLYAVDRWLLQRRNYPLLIVYTGDNAHKITVAPVDVDDLTYQLFQEHAKPKHTQHGILMLTSLAQFRSDYTIVLVPDGDLNAAAQQLYTNINLLRMGCAGRSGLTLEEPSDVTKDRFTSMYLLPQVSFNDTVLELVRLIQVSLYLFSYYPPTRPIDGLLCDFTLDGLSSWFKHVGRSYLDPVDRTTDPSVLSLLFSLVLAVRNRLAAISPHNAVPKDPFLLPRSFTSALATFNSSTPSSSSNASFLPVFLKEHTHSMPVMPTIHSQPSPVQPTLSQTPTLSLIGPTPPGSALQTPGTSPMPEPTQTTFLSPSLINSVFSTYDNKLKTSSKDRKGRNNGSIEDISLVPLPHPHVHLPSALTSAVTTSSGVSGIISPIPHLADLVSVVVGRKESIARTKQRQSEDRSRNIDSNPSDPSSSDDGLGVDISKAAAKVKARVRKSRDGARKVYASNKGKDADLTSVGGTLRGLWTGRVSVVVRLRQRAEQKQNSLDNDKEKDERDPSDGFSSWRSHHNTTKKSISLAKSKGSLWSDGDNTDSHPSGAPATRVSMPVITSPEVLKPAFSRRASVSGGRSRYGSVQSFVIHGEKSDGKSTEEEGAGGPETFGALWAKGGSKVRDKLESWTGLSKVDGKRRNKTHPETRTPSNNSSANVVDLSPVPSPLASPSFPPSKSPQSSPTTAKKRPATRLLLSPSSSMSQQRSTSRPQSPTVSGPFYGGYGDDDDDLLSSGQVSPVGGPNSSAFFFNARDPDGVVSGGEDPRTPRAIGRSTSRLGSPHASMSGLLYHSRSKPMTKGSDTDASLNESTMPSGQTNFRLQERDESAATAYAKKVSEVLGRGHPSKRPWPGNRIPYASRVSSWSDPVSARGQVEGDHNLGGDTDEDEAGDRLSREGVSEEEEKVRKGESRDVLGAMPPLGRRRNIVAVQGEGHYRHKRHQSAFSPSGWVTLSEEPSEYFDLTPTGGAVRVARSGSSREDESGMSHKSLGLSTRRRRSFHSLSLYRTDGESVDFNEQESRPKALTIVKVLPIDRMRIDVELCAQYLIMWRREEHLRNVVATLQILTSRLSDTNIHLREHYDSHLAELAELEARVKVIAEVDTENANANKISQATNTLWYEAEQFRVPDLWHAASPPRAKVLSMREKIFGTGGRRIPQGVHGAHGRFNRLQWTLDGQERLVDIEGKTESEFEEELGIDPKQEFIRPPEEDEEDVVDHLSIKPMWLLRFFTSWGTNWGASSSSHSTVPKAEVAPKAEEVEGKSVTADIASPKSEPRSPVDGSAVSLPVQSLKAEASKLEKSASL